MPIIDGDIDRVLAGLIKLQLLNIDDEIAQQEIRIGWHRHIDRHFDAWHHQPSILVDEIHLHLVRALLNPAKREAQRNRTLRVNRGQLTGKNRVERPKQVQLPIVIRRCIAQNRYLNRHTVLSTGKRYGPLSRLQPKSPELNESPEGERKLSPTKNSPFLSS